MAIAMRASVLLSQLSAAATAASASAAAINAHYNAMTIASAPQRSVSMCQCAICYQDKKKTPGPDLAREHL